MPTVDTRYSYKTWTITSGQASNLNSSTDLVLTVVGSINFLDTDFLTIPSQITVYHINTTTGEETELVQTTDWTFSGSDVTLLAAGTTIGTTWQAGDTIRIDRELQETAPLQTWTNNALINADNLNYAKDHTFYTAQRALDVARDSLGKNTAADTWDAQGLPSTNGAPATTTTGFTTLGQVQSLVSGVETATIADTNLWTISNSGATINLTGFEGTVSVEDLIVQIDGVMQSPDGTAYTVSGTNPPTVTLNTALTTGQRCDVRLIEGTVAAVLGSQTIAGSAIVDDSIDATKLNFGSGVTDRFLVINTSGDPTVQTIDHDDISDFDAAVEAKTLDAFGTSAGDINMGGFKITNLDDAELATDAATLADCDLEPAASVLETVQASMVDLVGGTFPLDLATGLDEGTYLFFGMIEQGAHSQAPRPTYTVNGTAITLGTSGSADTHSNCAKITVASDGKLTIDSVNMTGVSAARLASYTYVRIGA